MYNDTLLSICIKAKAAAKFIRKKTASTLRCLPFFGGSGWVRTTGVTDNRFTVCPLWPLGYTPIQNILFSLKCSVELVDGLEPPTC